MNRLRDEHAQEIGQPIMDTQAWYEMGTVLRDLGRREEARGAFEQALRNAISNDFQRRQAEQALKALQ